MRRRGCTAFTNTGGVLQAGVEVVKGHLLSSGVLMEGSGTRDVKEDGADENSKGQLR